LHRLAKRELASRGGGVSLSVTTLLHEAYLDMAGRAEARFPDRARFMGYAARVMRGLIIDHARNRQAQKRGGQFEITSFENENVAEVPDGGELARISEALDKLATVDAELAEFVDPSSSADSPSLKSPPCVACRSARCSANGKKQKSISIASYAPIYCEVSMSTLSPERWSALSPYLDKALTLSETERAVWLAALRAENPDLAGSRDCASTSWS
jgi:hypothetical protein